MNWTPAELFQTRTSFETQIEGGQPDGEGPGCVGEDRPFPGPIRQVGGVVAAIRGSKQAHEVIQRIYKGEREVYVLSDLGLFQE